MEILLFVLKYMFISLLMRMINEFSWAANIMASPFNHWKLCGKVYFLKSQILEWFTIEQLKYLL